MKKRILLLTISTLLLAACAGDSNSSSNSLPSFSDISTSVSNSDISLSENTLEPSEQSTTSESESSSNGSESSESSSEMSSQSSEESSHESSEEVVKYPVLNIKDIRKQALNYVGKENDKGVYESDFSLTLENFQLLASLDAITSKSGYGSRYKALVADKTGYLYLKVNKANYDFFEKGEIKPFETRGSYTCKGFISLYNGEVELTVNEKVEWHGENSSYDLNLESISEASNIDSILNYAKEMKLNCKGIAYSKLVSIDLKCLKKDFNGTNMFFGAGDKVIQVYGHNKVSNHFSNENSYHIIAAVQMFHFRPALVYVDSKIIAKEVNIDFSNPKHITYDDFYNLTYENDKYDSYPSYTNSFENVYEIEGYVNCYDIGGKKYLTLDDEFVEGEYLSDSARKESKPLYIQNDEARNIYPDSFDYVKNNPFIKAYNNGSKVRCLVFNYEWTSDDRPTVCVYSLRELLSENI